MVYSGNPQLSATGTVDVTQKSPPLQTFNGLRERQGGVGGAVRVWPFWVLAGLQQHGLAGVSSNTISIERDGRSIPLSLR